MYENEIAELEKLVAFWWQEGCRWVAELPVGDGIHARYVEANSIEELIQACKS